MFKALLNPFKAKSHLLSGRTSQGMTSAIKALEKGAEQEVEFAAAL